MGNRGSHRREWATPALFVRLAVLLAMAVLLVCAAPTGLAQARADGAPPAVATDVSGTAGANVVATQTAVPTTSTIAATTAWIKGRHGVVGCAVVASDGTLYGWGQNRQFASMSVVKAMLLVAYLREHTKLTPWARRTLTSMITVSDNAAASAIYRIVGARGLRAVARVAHMRHFAVGSSWSESRVTAADQAEFFYRMDAYIPTQHLAFARYVLTHIAPSQAWGIPRIARRAGWTSYTKGGWSGPSRSQIVHSVGRLEKNGTTIAIAVLTAGNATQGYGIATIEGFTARLLGLAH